MVLVFYILDNYVSILQTKLSDREGHEARRIGLEAMPLDEHIEGRHGEREPGVKIRPAPMHHLFEIVTTVFAMPIGRTGRHRTLWLIFIRAIQDNNQWC